MCYMALDSIFVDYASVLAALACTESLNSTCAEVLRDYVSVWVYSYILDKC